MLRHTIGSKKKLNAKQTLALGIVESENETFIGFAGIANISAINRSGEYFIVIGEKLHWGKGYGTEATKTVVDYGFNSLNLHRIMLTVSAPNLVGVKACLKAGFQQEGVLREDSYRDGAYHDAIAMSILRSEWELIRLQDANK